VSTGSSEVDDIRREMAKVRRELHADVQGVVSTAEAATDWKRYLTAYPYASLATAAVVGYMLVPRRVEAAAPVSGAVVQEDVAKLHALVAKATETVTEATKKIKPPRKGIVAAAIGLAAPMVFRAAQGYAMKYLEGWILQQQMSHPVSGPLFVRPGGAAPDSPRPTRKGDMPR